MDFREICDFFGGSIFLEEPRGNFKSSEERIQEREANANQSSDDEKAACLLLNIVHAALVGNIANEDGKPSCQTYLNAFYAEDRSQRWLFRVRSFSILLATWQFYPPLFRFCSLQRGPSSMLIETTLNPPKHILRLYQLNLAMIDDIDPLDKLEFSIIAALWMLSHRGLEAARVSNPSYVFHMPKPEHLVTIGTSSRIAAIN